MCNFELVEQYNKPSLPLFVSACLGLIDFKMAIYKAVVALVNFVAIGSTAPNKARAKVADGYVAAPYYPAPYGGWAEDWADSYAKAKELVDNMTLAEKTNITSGTGLFMGMEYHRHIKFLTDKT
jgi:hypothetical protein